MSRASVVVYGDQVPLHGTRCLLSLERQLHACSSATAMRQLQAAQTPPSLQHTLLVLFAQCCQLAVCCEFAVPCRLVLLRTPSSSTFEQSLRCCFCARCCLLLAQQWAVSLCWCIVGACYSAGFFVCFVLSGVHVGECTAVHAVSTISWQQPRLLVCIGVAWV